MTSILTSLNRTIISGTILTLLFIAYYISADGSIDEYFCSLFLDIFMSWQELCG